MAILIICWLLIGIASALIASSKGNSAFGGFMLGFLLSIIGLLICCLRGSRKEAIAHQQHNELLGMIASASGKEFKPLPDMTRWSAKDRAAYMAKIIQ